MEIKGAFSDWLPVTNGVTQWSVLIPLLFTLFVNGFNNGIDGFVADDMKIGGGIGSAEEAIQLQQGLDKVEVAKNGRWNTVLGNV